MSIVNVNGETYILFNNSDIIEVIKECCGYELALIVENKILEVDYQKLLAEEKAKTDEESYLASLESSQSCLNDILDIAEKGTKNIEESKRINKEKIYKMFQDIIKLIENEI